jgi:hypothetical protein
MKKHLALALSLLLFQFLHAGSYNIAITPSPKNPDETYFRLGTATNPKDESLLVSPQSIVRNGQPILPVMGEIHFSRVPQAEWKKALLQMKAGGITVVATYVFWIHHEENEGKFRWDGQRDLRAFIQTCREVGLPLVLRLGPWCHGEVRNGGVPEWMVNSGIKLRNSNAAYLDKVRIWYSQIFEQTKGLLWKDGGPVIGVQLENEYRGPGEHLITLKTMAQEIGFDLPLYTRTGWPALTKPIPFGEILPLFGDYPDGFWDRSLQEMPGDYSKAYLFRSFRSSTVIATEMLPKQAEKDNAGDWSYPYLTCELGGGMMPSYHRRIAIDPMDIYAMALVKVGSGSNLPGYYMYHGGTNPEGENTTLNERQNSKLTNNNDLPEKSYDFQAPLGEFGQINPQYHLLRRLHLFLHDFGSDLTRMNAYYPEPITNDAGKDSLLRWAVRSDGQSGFVFVNNYQRLKTLSAKTGVQFRIGLPNQTLVFPAEPVTVPSGVSFILPFNLPLGNARLAWTTTQPLAKWEGSSEKVYVFSCIRGIKPEFAFEAGIKMLNGKGTIENGLQVFRTLKPGSTPVLEYLDKSNQHITILLLDEAQALRFWKGNLAGQERLLLSDADLTCLDNSLELTSKKNLFSVELYPAPTRVQYDNQVLQGKKDGLFTQFSVSEKALPKVPVKLQQVQAENPHPRKVVKGKAGVSEQPSDTDFDQAAVWNLRLPATVDPQRDLMLQLPYQGDVARIELNGKLLTDNFFNGKVFELGLKRYAPEIYGKTLTLRILPLAKNAPIYLHGQSELNFGNKGYVLSLKGVQVTENRTVALTVQ